MKDNEGNQESNIYEINESIYTKRSLKKILGLKEKIYTKAGNILDFTHIYSGVDGELNGFVVGDKGRFEVRTIYAGGYNIQRLHYRTLIRKV